MRMGTIVAVLFVALHGPGMARADKAIKPGRVELYPTRSAVGIELPFTDDDNQNATAAFVWRKKGEEMWRNGVDMTIDRKHRFLWASIWPLEPGEAVEVKITVADPDSPDLPAIAESTVTRPLLVPVAGGRAFYVSPDGDNSAAGSKEKPFKTLGHAAAMVRPGDTVHVMTGVYPESDLLKGLRGTAEKPITFTAAADQAPILDSSLTLAKDAKAWKKVEDQVFAAEVDFDGGYVAQDGLRMFHYPTVADLKADKQKVKRAWHYDPAKKLLHIRTGTGSTPAEHTYHLSRHTYGFHLSGSQNLVIRGFTIRNYGGALVRVSEGAQNCVLLENKLHNGPGGVFMKGETTRDNAIWKNEIHEPGMEDISWNANYAHGYANQAIYCDKAGRGNSICHNRIHDHFDFIAVESWKNPDKLGYNRDCDILFNDMWNAGDDAIEVDGGGVNMRVHGNTIRQCFTAFSLAPVERGPVYVTRNTASFLNLFLKLNVSGCTSNGWTYVYHNTGYCLLNGADGGTGISFPPGIPCANKVMKNNIVISNEWSVRAGLKGNVLDGNCYFNVPGKPPRRFQWDKKTYNTLADFQRATEQEKHGLYLDPKLVDISDVGKIPVSPEMANLPPRQYRLADRPRVSLELQPNSPCIDAAVPLRGINDQGKGKGADIGALETKKAGR